MSNPTSPMRGAVRGRLAALVLALVLPVAAEVTREGDRFVGDDGTTELLAWAYGAVTPETLDEYAALGLNVLYLDLPVGEAAAADARALAKAAAARGLYIVIGLNALDAAAPASGLDPIDETAVEATVGWIRRTVREWKETPGLIAWALQHEPEDRLSWSTAGFAHYLAAQYGDLDTLNLLWHSALNSFEAATPEAVTQLDLATPATISRASLDVARWRMETASGLLGAWADAAAGEDPAHPVIGGRAPRIRELLNAPSGLAALQPALGDYDARPLAVPLDLPPEVAVRAIATPPAFAAEAVTAAHQAGRYAVIPCLDAAATLAQLDDSIPLAFSHGACGVCFSSLEALLADPDRREAVTRRLSQARRERWAEFSPRGTAALLTSPYCRGPQSHGRDLFGYGAFGGDEPAGLLDLLRRGTRYGSLDVLTPRDLRTTDLSRYNAVICASAFDLSAADSEALNRYVAAGGRLLADLGVGCYQAGGDLADMPPPLREVFGVSTAAVLPLLEVVLRRDERERVLESAPGTIVFDLLDLSLAHPGSLVFKRPSVVFPQIEPVIATSPWMSRWLLLSPTAFVWPDDTARMIAEQAQLPERMNGRAATAGLTVNPYGQGIGVYWGTFGFADWGLGEKTFEGVFDALLGHEPPIVLRGAVELSPLRHRLARGRSGVWLENLTGGPQPLEVDVAGSEPRLYERGLNMIRRPELLPGGPAPGTGRWGFVNQRLVPLRAGEVLCNREAPIALWPQEAEATAEVEWYRPESLALRIWGQGGEPRVSGDGVWYMRDSYRTEVLLVIGDGDYRLEPGSLHRARWWSTLRSRQATQSREETETLTVNADAQIIVRREAEDLRLELTPLRDRPVAPGADEG